MKWKYHLQTVAAIIALALVMFSSLVIAQDALEYFQTIKGKYQTPWYDNRWWKQPFTHFALACGGTDHIYWTTNDIGNQRWRVTETTVGGKTFWTITERHPLCEKP